LSSREGAIGIPDRNDPSSVDAFRAGRRLGNLNTSSRRPPRSHPTRIGLPFGHSPPGNLRRVPSTPAPQVSSEWSMRPVIVSRTFNTVHRASDAGRTRRGHRSTAPCDTNGLCEREPQCVNQQASRRAPGTFVAGARRSVGIEALNLIRESLTSVAVCLDPGSRHLFDRFVAFTGRLADSHCRLRRGHQREVSSPSGNSLCVSTHLLDHARQPLF
jgi:hypothetical protein